MLKLKLVLFVGVSPFVKNVLKTYAVCVVMEGRVFCLARRGRFGGDVATVLLLVRTVVYFLMPLSLTM